jgi:hypothetical protein
MGLWWLQGAGVGAEGTGLGWEGEGGGGGAMNRIEERTNTHSMDEMTISIVPM